jgi:hypothetical protein
MSLEGTRSHKLTVWALAVAITAGGVGVALRVAGVHSAVGSALVLLFVAVAPTVAFYGLLRSFDPFARIILAATTNVAFLVLTASLMLVEGIWSPVGGLLAVAVITLACLVAQWSPVRRQVTATANSWRWAVQNRLAHASATDQGSNAGR